MSFLSGLAGVGVGSWLGKLWLGKLLQEGKAKLDLQVESHKTSLRKSEFLFEREFEATLTLSSLLREILPSPWHVDVDYEDACEYLAPSLGDLAKKVEHYLNLHSAALTPDALKLVVSARRVANLGKLEDGGDSKAARTLLDNLSAAESLMRKALRGQVNDVE